MTVPAASRPSVVVVGGGFAGFFAARTLERLLPAHAADLTLISATDHLCYSPLLPEVAAGRLEPRRIAVPPHAPLRRTRVLPGGRAGAGGSPPRCPPACGAPGSCRPSWRTSTSTGTPSPPRPTAARPRTWPGTGSR